MLRKFVFASFIAAALYSGSMTKPRYAEGNRLLRPEGYREWVFTGANYGMSYTEGDPAAASKPKTFHNIYIQPEAYRHYAKTGQFPDQTMLVMEIVKAGTNASINKQGMFEDEFVGIEVALKDEKKFPEKWAYFKFFESDGKILADSKPFPKEACWDCHNKHAAVDNVFVQFHAVLKNARK
ncbi:MAG: cytochrome P460 family protein [Bryobacteraceae bacterium]